MQPGGCRPARLGLSPVVSILRHSGQGPELCRMPSVALAKEGEAGRQAVQAKVCLADVGRSVLADISGLIGPESFLREKTEKLLHSVAWMYIVYSSAPR